MSTNPWHVSLVKAEKTGVMVADILYRCRRNASFILMGHSLGARVIYSALSTLSTAEEPIIEEVHLFGGAVGNQSKNWQQAQKAVRGDSYNYHSNNDTVLKYLYSVGTFFSSDPIGRTPISNVEGVQNIDVTKQVSGHGQFKINAPSFLQTKLSAGPAKWMTIVKNIFSFFKKD